MRIYQFHDNDCEFVVNVVADTWKEARPYAFTHEAFDDVEWIDIRGSWFRSLKPEELGLKKGLVCEQLDMIEILRLGLYGWIWLTCPTCNKETTYHQEDDIECECGYNWETK